MNGDIQLCINYWADDNDYCDIKYSDTPLVLRTYGIPLIMPLGACIADINSISIFSDEDFVSSPIKNKDVSWKSDTGQNYSDTACDGISLYNKDRAAAFEIKEILGDDLIEMLKNQR